MKFLKISILFIFVAGCAANRDPYSWALGNENYILERIQHEYNIAKKQFDEGGHKITTPIPTRIQISLDGKAIRLWTAKKHEDNDKYHKEIAVNKFDGTLNHYRLKPVESHSCRPVPRAPDICPSPAALHS